MSACANNPVSTVLDTNHYAINIFREKFRLSVIGGLDHWTGSLDWTQGGWTCVIIHVTFLKLFLMFCKKLFLMSVCTEPN